MPNLNGNAFPCVAGRAWEAVPAIASKWLVVASTDDSGGDGRGEAVVEGEEGGACEMEVGERMNGSLGEETSVPS